MTRSDLQDAFDHHLWATEVLIDVCGSLSPAQLDASVPGTYGSILDTMRHTVGADAWYLHVMTGGRVARIDEDTMDLDQLRTQLSGHASAWASVLAGLDDPDVEVVAHRDDGSEGHAPLGIRVAQALHHGTDHRSQICTGLTALGITPPEIDVWAFGDAAGRVFDVASRAP